jgi:hypothetical protein
MPPDTARGSTIASPPESRSKLVHRCRGDDGRERRHESVDPDALRLDAAHAHRVGRAVAQQCARDARVDGLGRVGQRVRPGGVAAAHRIHHGGEAALAGRAVLAGPEHGALERHGQRDDAQAEQRPHDQPALVHDGLELDEHSLGARGGAEGPESYGVALHSPE